jgi:hypothetical protein
MKTKTIPYPWPQGAYKPDEPIAHERTGAWREECGNRAIKFNEIRCAHTGRLIDYRVIMNGPNEINDQHSICAPYPTRNGDNRNSVNKRYRVPSV